MRGHRTFFKDILKNGQKPRGSLETTVRLPKSGKWTAREFRGLLPGNDARPADVFIRSWIKGQDAVLDVTVVSPLQAACINRAADEQGYALDYAKQRKM